MESLSDEMVMEILSRVRTLDLVHAKCVCKRWKTIIEEPRWHELHCSYSISNPNNKILIVDSGNKFCFVDLSDEIISASQAKLRVCIPRKDDLEIVGSCNGLLCLTDCKHENFYIMNPFIDDYISELPGFPDEKSYTFGFGYDATTNSYKVMAIVSPYLPQNLQSEVMVSEFGGMMNWRKVGKTLYHYNGITYPQTFLNGRLHWFHGLKEIVSFDFTDEKLRLIPLPDSLILCTNCDLIVFQNRLCIVETYQTHGALQMQLQVWIMKKYDVKDSWVKEFDTESVGLRIRKPLKSVPGPMRVKALGEVGNGKILFYCTAPHLTCMLMYEPRSNHKYKYVECEDLPNLWRSSTVVHNPSLGWTPRVL